MLQKGSIVGLMMLALSGSPTAAAGEASPVGSATPAYAMVVAPDLFGSVALPIARTRFSVR